jgi:hypothetical protein
MLLQQEVKLTAKSISDMVDTKLSTIYSSTDLLARSELMAEEFSPSTINVESGLFNEHLFYTLVA